jgi:hypothetical protein
MTAKLFVLPLVFAVSLMAASAQAQLPGAPVTARAGPGYQAVPPGVPSFTDPKTGQVWTPDNVGGAGNPALPQDRAFNPAGQAVASQQVYRQQAQMHVIGAVPITAGPTVPLVVIDNPSLTVRAGGRWQVVLYLQNNSGNTLAPGLDCSFTNGGKPVLTSYVSVPPVAGGMRVGLTFVGPPSDIFVDSVGCGVAREAELIRN